MCKELDKSLLRIDCRRHVTELEIKHFAGPITGRGTTAPGDILFKRYQEKFDTIRDSINYQNLNTFKWPEEGSFIYEKAKEVAELVQKMIEEDTFTRGDYKDLAVLVYVYLTGETDINGKRFRVSLPHGVSHARFMQRGLYYITLQLLGTQADYMNYSEVERREVELLAEFSALFYTPMFLQSLLAAEAPTLDLKNIQDLRRMVRISEEEYEAEQNEKNRAKLEALRGALGNVYHHPDYLTQTNIVMALAGDTMSDEDKTVIARCIWDTLEKAGGIVDNFPFNPDNMKKMDICSIWPEDEQRPDLCRFIGHNSLNLFYHLGMADKVSLSWMTKEPKEWKLDVDYEKFREFV